MFEAESNPTIESSLTQRILQICLGSRPSTFQDKKRKLHRQAKDKQTATSRCGGYERL